MEESRCLGCDCIIYAEHYRSENGNSYCLECAEEFLSYSEYGYYDKDETDLDPDLWLDDDLSDIEFFHLALL